LQKIGWKKDDSVKFPFLGGGGGGGGLKKKNINKKSLKKSPKNLFKKSCQNSPQFAYNLQKGAEGFSTSITSSATTRIIVPWQISTHVRQIIN
jgi:hypothetical protein